MRKVLIVGASGFLGWNLAKKLRGAYEVTGTFGRNPVERDGCRMEKLDLASKSDAAALVRRCSPEVILNAAALIDVDLCERERERAAAINAEGSRIVAELAAEVGARLIYFSTDMVFDGRKGMYSEEEAPHPVNWYGETKLAGETWARDCCPRAVIARLALMYGAGSRAHGSFFQWMLRRLEKGERVNLFTDQFRTPTFVGDVCLAVEKMIERPEIAGVYHLAGPERMNRYEFGTRLVDVFHFPLRLLRPVRMEDLRNLMPRPKDNSLDGRRAERELQIRFKGVVDGLRAVAEEMKNIEWS
ncbi:MAG: dTDP-4-dehydrorhamnose reductase [Candidatus Aureabacteria bacterium]|nr:dTDP-4-dehydrorhamnose reductase [Candidatus Auribacterota bacterium]